MDLCKMFEFDCKVTQNISINIFFVAENQQFLHFTTIFHQNPRLFATTLQNYNVLMPQNLFSNNVEISFDGGVGDIRCFLLTLHFKTGLVPICKRNRI